MRGDLSPNPGVGEIVPAGAQDHVGRPLDGELPAVIYEAGPNARYAYEEFFFGRIDNAHTRAAYRRDVNRFLDHVHDLGLVLHQVTPKLVRSYLENLAPLDPASPPLSVPTRKRVLAALRAFFDAAVTRHAILLNPALSVRGPRYAAVEGRTPAITVRQARGLLASIGTGDVIGLRDRAILATMVYTGARVGAVAKLTLAGFYSVGGDRWYFRFDEKGGKVRQIPCRRDLRTFVADYLCAAGLEGQKAGPLFRSARPHGRGLTDRAITANDVCRMVKRRLRAAELPPRLSPHSFRVTVATDLLAQRVPLEDVQHLLGHADARTTKLYDRRARRVMPNVVDRISV